MKTYYIRNIFESRSGIGIDIIPDDISEETRTFYVSQGFLKKHKLQKGQDIDEVLFSEIEEHHTLRRAIYKAADILAVGVYSVLRLKMMLTEKGFSKETAEAAALYMEERGYIREYEAAERMARFLLETKNRGKQRIIAELSAKGYNKAAIKSAAESISEEEYYEALCRQIKMKYKTTATDRKEQEKRIAAMIRQGFKAGDVLRAMSAEK